MTQPTKADIAVNLYLEGKTLHEVGEALSITHERARQILLGQGITLRKPGPLGKLRLKKSFGKLTTKEKFMSLVRVEENGCWTWLGKLHAGYGRFRAKGRLLYAHQAAFIVLKGKPHRGPLRCTCKVKGCVNPEHWKEPT